MVLLGLDDEIINSPWIWMCTLCMRCKYACPMNIDIPGMITQARANWEREKRPEGIRKSCDLALTQPTHSSMGADVENWKFVVEDVAEEVRDEQPGFEELQAPMDKQGAEFFLNQNSREPVTEPDEMVPLWKILHEVGADWTYGSKGWAAENYCMFLADMENWEKIVREKAQDVDELGCKVWLNTE
jgi:Fe-S oxidoreductase